MHGVVYSSVCLSWTASRSQIFRFQSCSWIFHFTTQCIEEIAKKDAEPLLIRYGAEGCAQGEGLETVLRIQSADPVKSSVRRRGSSIELRLGDCHDCGRNEPQIYQLLGKYPHPFVHCFRQSRTHPLETRHSWRTDTWYAFSLCNWYISTHSRLDLQPSKPLWSKEKKVWSE